jgi:amino acid adenylation domain-containing protein
MDASQEHALHARFLRGMAENPGGLAVRYGAQAVSYEAAYQLALEWAGSLLAGASEPPRAVGVLADKGVESYVGILAALFTGAAVVPLHPEFPADRTRRMLEDAGVGVVLADAHGMDALSRTGLSIPALSPGRSAQPAGQVRAIRVESRSALSAPRPIRADDVAYILFTSGSTGRAKGVPITHANLFHYFRLMDRRYDFTAEDVFSQTVELNFDCAMFDLFCAWGAGACVQAIPMQAIRDLPAFAAERKMTVWFSVPSIISLVRRMGGLSPGSLPTLRWSLFAGEALRCSDAADWQAAASSSVLENLYGPTELTITITAHRWSSQWSPRAGVNGIVPVGTMHEGHDYLLLTEDRPADEHAGELCVTGPQMAAGYLDPEDNLGRFVDRAGRRWYRTGDRVRRLPDGELAYLGRLDSQVQVHGLRVELAEVDHAMRSCTGVTDAVTVAIESDDDTQLVVFYTGSRAHPAELARQVRLILPEGMVPKHYRHIDELPLNANGKVDRARLALHGTDDIDG